MDRVKEVVDWCMDEGLYVIINSHHDNLKGYYYPSSAEKKTSLGPDMPEHENLQKKRIIVGKSAVTSS